MAVFVVKHIRYVSGLNITFEVQRFGVEARSLAEVRTCILANVTRDSLFVKDGKEYLAFNHYYICNLRSRSNVFKRIYPRLHIIKSGGKFLPNIFGRIDTERDARASKLL